MKLKELELREKEFEIKTKESLLESLHQCTVGQNLNGLHLIPQLSGKALEAYSRMSLTESNHYDLKKKAILDRYGLRQVQSEYREKFRGCKQASGETYKEFSVRLKSYFDHWKETEAIDND